MVDQLEIKGGLMVFLSGVLKGMEIEQVAIITDDAQRVKDALKVIGVQDWVTDEVVAEGEVFGERATNKAELNFNYQFGFEFEILQYKEGKNWHSSRRAKYPRLSHLGYHVESEEKLQEIMKAAKNEGIEIAQEVFTKSHTNEYLLKKKRKFHYVIFDTQDLFGFDLKLIVRRENES